MCGIGWALRDRLKSNVSFYIFSREKGVFIIKMFTGEKQMTKGEKVQLNGQTEITFENVKVVCFLHSISYSIFSLLQILDAFLS